MDLPLHIGTVEKFTVIEFKMPSLMDPIDLQNIGDALYKLVDEQDKRLIILDFEQVQYISSQAIGIILTMNKKPWGTALKKQQIDPLRHRPAPDGTAQNHPPGQDPHYQADAKRSHKNQHHPVIASWTQCRMMQMSNSDCRMPN